MGEVEALSPVRLTPVDIAGVPEVSALLRTLGLGTLCPDEVTAYFGRHDNWVGTTESGRRLFIKRIGGSSAESLAAFRRAVTFEEMTAAAGPTWSRAALRSPSCFGWDVDSRLVVFEAIEGGSSGGRLADEGGFGVELSRLVGRAVGELHSLSTTFLGRLDRSCPPLPPLGHIRALPMGAYLAASAAELEFWAMVQGDLALVSALADLRAVEREAPRCAAHCDLRLDQLIVRGDAPFLSDWEEFRLADPARDIGSYVGEWLYRAVLALGRNGLDGCTSEEILRRGAAELAAVRPWSVAFWAGYREIRRDADTGLAERATAFAGWHLLDRILAVATERAYLTPLLQAAAGIGRAALLSPSSFTTVLGLGESS